MMMKGAQCCANCAVAFDGGKHVPRILSTCGHTFCEVCLAQTLATEHEAAQKKLSYHRKGTAKAQQQQQLPTTLTFECYECGKPCQVDAKLGVASMTVNQVLIQVN